jgi:hypothetical protein
MSKQRDSRAETQCKENARSGGYWTVILGKKTWACLAPNAIKTTSSKHQENAQDLKDESGRFVMPSVNRSGQ